MCILCQVEGRSLYGLITKFIRVLCEHTRDVTDLAVVKWFSPPTYPDGDPLLVKIGLDDPPPIIGIIFVFRRDWPHPDHVWVGRWWKPYVCDENSRFWYYTGSLNSLTRFCTIGIFVNYIRWFIYFSSWSRRLSECRSSIWDHLFVVSSQ